MESRMKLAGTRQSSYGVSGFEQYHPLTGAGQQGCANQAVVSGADDYGIV
jgi:hypothetical protein